LVELFGIQAIPSYMPLQALSNALDSVTLKKEVILWGSWARLFTRDACTPPKDVDIIISKQACIHYYDLVRALIKNGFKSVHEINDDQLSQLLKEEKLELTDQNPTSPPKRGHGMSWKHLPSRISLDIAFDPEYFSSIPNHDKWVDDTNGSHDWLKLYTVSKWEGCKNLFDGSKRYDLSLGIAVPTVERQKEFAQHALDSCYRRFKLEENEYVKSKCSLDKFIK